MIKYFIKEIFKNHSPEEKVFDVLVERGSLSKEKNPNFIEEEIDYSILLDNKSYLTETDLSNSIILNAKIVDSYKILELTDEYTLYKIMKKIGITEETIIRNYEEVIGLEYKNVSNLDFNCDDFNDLEFVEEIFAKRVFPFLDYDNDNALSFIVGTLESYDYIKEICEELGLEKNIFTSYSFDIDKKINESERTCNAFSKNKFKKTIILGSGQDNIDEIVKKYEEFVVLDTIQYKESLLSGLIVNKPDILIVSDSLGGKEPLIPILLQIKQKYPSIRIIYFTGELDIRDTLRIQNLGLLTSIGIYDIIHEQVISTSMIYHVLKNPRSKDAIMHLTSKISDNSPSFKKKKAIEITLPEAELYNDEIEGSKIFTFISPVGGQGKTLIASNIALAIQSYGVNNLLGTKPRVLYIDLDTISFSGSTVLGARDNEKNIFNILREINKVLTPEGNLKGNETDMKILLEVIHKNIKKVDNGIHIIGGPSRNYEENDYKLNHHFIGYLIESLENDYDVIIIDTNPQFEFDDIFHALYVSRYIYSVITPDFNVIKTERRLSKLYDELSLKSKMKYILNKNVKNLVFNKEVIEEQLGYDFIGDITKMDEDFLWNLSYENIILMKSNDRRGLIGKLEIINLSNDLWPLKDYEKAKLKLARTRINPDAVIDDKPNLKNILEKGKDVLNKVLPKKIKDEFSSKNTENENKEISSKEDNIEKTEDNK